MRFIESICIENGQPQRLALHQQRVGRAFAAYFPGAEVLDLEAILGAQALPVTGIHKARLIYNGVGLAECTIAEYQPRPHRRIGLVDAPGFRYPHKLEDRRFFDDLFHQYPDLDDFIVLHNGLLTDSTYCNLALFDGRQWFTPTACLLPGTRRADYLQRGMLQEAQLAVGQIASFKKIAFINAMRGLEFASELEEIEFISV